MSFSENRKIPKYEDITPEEYDKLMKDAEILSLLTLEAFMKENWGWD